MRFWFLDAPAWIISVLFQAYFIVLAALALLCFLTAIYSLLALGMGWPPIW